MSGGGGPAYQVSWTPWSQASRSNKPILVYPQARPSEYSTVCCTKTAQELSRKYPFVKIPYAKSTRELPAESRKLLEELELGGNELFVILDPHGNELTREKAPMNERGLQKAIEKVEKLAEKLHKEIRSAFERAKRYDDRDSVRSALKYYGKVLEYKGYSEVKEAEERVEEIFVEGRWKMREILSSEDLRNARRELRRLQSDYRDTPLEEEIKNADEELKERIYGGN